MLLLENGPFEACDDADFPNNKPLSFSVALERFDGELIETELSDAANEDNGARDGEFVATEDNFDGEEGAMASSAI